jgi:predicted methyltransferase
MDLRPWLAALALVSTTLGCGASKPAATDADEDVEKKFTSPEEWARVFDDPERDAWQRPDRVVAILGVRPGMTAADIGAGTGYFARTLSRAVGPTGKVIAADIDPTMVRFLQRRVSREGLANVEPTLARADDPGLPPAGIDRILIVDTWRFIADRPAYAAKLAAALRPDGTITIIDYLLDSRVAPPDHHGLPPETVIAELATAGLAAELIDEDLPEQYVVRARPR